MRTLRMAFVGGFAGASMAGNVATLHAAPLPTNVASMKSMVDDSSIQVRRQSRHCATGNIEAFALELPPDLAHAIDGEVVVEHAPDLDLQGGVLPGARRQLGRIASLGDMGAVGRGGDRQDLADRLDPMRPTMIVMKAIMACTGGRAPPSQNR